MKETYKSPVLAILCLAASERLANTDIDFDEVAGNPSTGSGSGVIGGTQIELPL